MYVYFEKKIKNTQRNNKTDTDEKRKIQAIWRTMCTNYAVSWEKKNIHTTTTIFSSQRSIYRHCAFLSLFFFTTLLLLFWPSFFLFFLFHVLQPMAIAHTYFKRDSHSQARKPIKTKNKKRNKNRLPIRVPHTLVFFFFFFFFWTYIDGTSISTTTTTISTRQVKPTEIFIWFFVSLCRSFFILFYFRFCALRFSMFSQLWQ